MGALSPWHIILIAIVALLLFGPNKLPELGRGFGKMFREFKDATNNNGNSSNDELPTRKEVNPSEASVSNTASSTTQANANGQVHQK